MKNLPKFEEFLNEATETKLHIEGPYDEKSEAKAPQSWALKRKPITVKKVVGDITESGHDLYIIFSNDDRLEYVWDPRIAKGHLGGIGEYEVYMSRIEGHTKTKKISSDKVQDYMGSTGTVVGDLLLIYSDWINEKIK